MKKINTIETEIAKLNGRLSFIGKDSNAFEKETSRSVDLRITNLQLEYMI